MGRLINLQQGHILNLPALQHIADPTLLSFIFKVESFLIPCPVKYLTGIDCPGCGFQRSVIALLNGNFRESFLFYPATIPLFISFFCGVSATYLKVKISDHILKALYFATGAVIFVHYILKIFNNQLSS